MSNAQTINSLKPEALYTIDQLAELTGLNRRTLSRHMQKGRLGYYKIGGSVRFCRRHLEEFLAANEKRPSLKNFKKRGRSIADE